MCIVTGYSKETSVYLFEELVSDCFRPSDLMPILQSCQYSAAVVKEYLLDDRSVRVQRLRQSSASDKIFRKYRWNSMDSGWHPFF